MIARRILAAVLTVSFTALVPMAAAVPSAQAKGIAAGGGGREAADFNCDGHSDLAIGVPGESVGVATSAGGVNVIYGSKNGLVSKNNQFFTQDTAGIADTAESNDSFGFAVAAGDLNGDGCDDLAIGVNGESVGSVANAGAVEILYGSVNGLKTKGSDFFTENSAGIPGTAELGDHFGGSLAIGNFAKGPEKDLAVGITDKNVSTATYAGAVQVLYGSSNGVTTNGNQLFTRDSLGLTSANSDEFGFSLAAGNFGQSSQDDLAIGVVGASFLGATQAGAVDVVYGSAKKLQPRWRHIARVASKRKRRRRGNPRGLRPIRLDDDGRQPGPQLSR